VRQRQVPERAATPSSRKSVAAAPVQATERKRRLTFKEKTELEALPDEIDTRESERDLIYASLADPGFLRDGSAVTAAKIRLDALELEIARMMQRWEELETVAREG
jgi:ATP-binding cassette subfamily F protein uup